MLLDSLIAHAIEGNIRFKLTDTSCQILRHDDSPVPVSTLRVLSTVDPTYSLQQTEPFRVQNLGYDG
jgi:hypothetical protein